MNRTIKNVYEEIGATTGLIIDEPSDLLTGEYNGYHFTVYYSQNGGYYVDVSVSKAGQPATQETLVNARKSIYAVKTVHGKEYIVSCLIKGHLRRSIVANTVSAIKEVSDFLKMNGYVDMSANSEV